jgi:hypothetical protein
VYQAHGHKLSSLIHLHGIIIDSSSTRPYLKTFPYPLFDVMHSGLSSVPGSAICWGNTSAATLPDANYIQVLYFLHAFATSIINFIHLCDIVSEWFELCMWCNAQFVCIL